MRARIETLCVRWGGDRLLVQGAGGNVSWKQDNVLWIKASGTWLAQALERDVFVPVDLEAMRAALAAGDVDTTPRVLGEAAARPSIETALHALMPQPVVAHLHMVDALARLVRTDGGDALPLLRQAGLRCAEVPYCKPGASLARAVAAALGDMPDCEVLLMRSHGIVAGAGSVEALDDLVARIGALLACPAAIGPMAADAPPIAGLVPLDELGLHALASDAQLLRRVADDWALYPDHVVFLGPVACIAGRDPLPPADAARPVFVPGRGVYARAPLPQAQGAQLRCYADVIARQPASASLRRLGESEIGELVDWDAERYRQSLQAAPRAVEPPAAVP